jgi:hypothetical protein
MIYRKVLLVSLLLAAQSASSVVGAKKQTKAGKKADLGASKCTNGKKGKKCKLERTKDKDIFASNDISIQLEADGTIQEFEFVGGGSRQGGGNKHPQWYGVSDDDFAMNLIESEGKLFGSYSDNDYIYSISTDDDGNPIVTEQLMADFPDEEQDDGDLNLESFPGNPSDHGEGESNNDNVFAHESMRKLGLRGRSASSSFLNTTERKLPEAHTTLDIMVVWTTDAECNNHEPDLSVDKSGCTLTEKTTASMRGRINLAVSETNVAFEQSGIRATLKLVHAYREPAYTEYETPAVNRTVMKNALYDMRGDRVADVHDKRIKYGADLVAMIVHARGSCGIGFKGPRKDLMFSVTAWNCATGYYSFGHEIGHNMVSRKSGVPSWNCIVWYRISLYSILHSVYIQSSWN